MKVPARCSASVCLALALTLPSSPVFAATPPPNLVGLTARANALILFNAGAPGRPQGQVRVTGLAVGEDLIGIDYRPATGELYGLTTAKKLYTLDPVTGASTLVGGPFAGPLVGIEFGFDFNPIPDRIRLVGELTGQNLRLNPNNGALAATDTTLFYKAGDPNAGAAPRIVAVAYTDNFAGTGKTTLYGIDSALDVLVRIGGIDGIPSPNGGELTTVGALGVNVSDLCGLDVSPNGGAFASFTNAAGISELYTINLATGAATRIDRIAGDVVMRDVAVIPPAKPRLFAATADNRLVSFRPGTPGVLLSDAPISGLVAGDAVVGLDFRPATGELYALGSASRVYVIDTATAVATVVGANSFAPALNGASFGFDFNPIPDRIRVVSDTDMNARLNPDTGATAATDTSVDFAAGDVNFGAPRNVVASAYSDDFAGTTKTTLYGIDSGLDVLVRQGGVDGVPSPNGGLLSTIGPLNFDTTGDASFDISPYGGAFAALTAPGASTSIFATVNLATGAITSFGTIAGGQIIKGLAFEPPVQPRVLALTSSNRIVTVAPGRPSLVMSNLQIVGLDAGENVLGFDFRPATGELIAVTSLNRLQRIDPSTAVAVPVTITGFSPALTATQLGVDFNPIPDRLRVVNANEQNLRVNANNSVAVVDSILAYAAGDAGFGFDPRIVGSAYTRSFSGSTSTTLYGIDSTRDVLVTQGGLNSVPSPNGGMLFSVGPIGVDTNDNVGFDVAVTGAAFASLTVGATSTLYTINLATGQSTALGVIGGGETIVDIAILIRGL
ncbi:MAG: DUF4394 domain-containing protein [Planctomycetes bacterium]|nr:DUF4394 domain-containing protein [Planctomycetota bacterium]